MAEQRRLLQSVANVGEELLSQQTTPNGDRYWTNWLSCSAIGSECHRPVLKGDSLCSRRSELSITGGVLLDNEPMSPLDQLRQRWENLNKDQNTKLRLSLNSLEHEQLSPVSAAVSFIVFTSHPESLASFGVFEFCSSRQLVSTRDIEYVLHS